METPVEAARQTLVKAYLEILVPKVDDPIIPLRFNPTEYQLQKGNNFSDVPIPGLESPPIQFVRGAAEKLTTEFLVDTSDTLENVAEKYVNKLRDLMRINQELHAPPIVRFTWDRQIFKGVLESLNTTYTMFSPEGVPLRAKLNVTLKEYRPVEVQVKESPVASANVEKSFVARGGDSFSSIASIVYNDSSQWRAIAQHNGIDDPRRIEPGSVLDIPRLR